MSPPPLTMLLFDIAMRPELPPRPACSDTAIGFWLMIVESLTLMSSSAISVRLPGAALVTLIWALTTLMRPASAPPTSPFPSAR